MADLVSALIWQPMGAEHDAGLLHDGLGVAVHDWGLCATARDVARFGQLLLDGGVVPDGTAGVRRVVPPRWLRQGWRSTPTSGPCSPHRPPRRCSPAAGTATSSGSGRAGTGTCCSAWAFTARCCTSAGRTCTVCVKFSTWPRAQEPVYLQDTLRAFDAIGGVLGGRERPGGPERGASRSRLPGVVSGLSRHGDTAPPGGARPQ